MDLRYLLVLLTALGFGWWLSGYDSQVTGENRFADFKRRAIRSLVSLFLMGLGLSAASGGGRIGGFICIAIVLPLALTWCGCLSELFARAFHHLTDSPDSREFDAQELPRALDRLSTLVEQGRSEEAIQLCGKLMQSAEGSAPALEAMLFRAYDKMFEEAQILAAGPLAEIHRLCEQGRCLEAQSRLNELLKREPGNLHAGLALMRLYAFNLRVPEKAYNVLKAFQRGGGARPGFFEYAQHRIKLWADPGAADPKSTEGIESLLVDPKYVTPARQ